MFNNVGWRRIAAPGGQGSTNVSNPNRAAWRYNPVCTYLAVETSEIRFRLKEFMGLYSDEGKIQPTYSKLIFTPNINGYSWEIATSSHEVKGIVPSSTSSTIATLLNNLFEI